MTSPRTLAQKVWDRHVVHSAAGEPDLLYIDLHLVHEVTSPQAFTGLRTRGLKVRRPERTKATMRGLSGRSMRSVPRPNSGWRLRTCSTWRIQRYSEFSCACWTSTLTIS